MKRCQVVLFISLLSFLPLLQAEPAGEKQILEEIFKIPSPTGYEENMILKIRQLLPEDVALERNSLDSLYATWSNGGDHLAVVAGVDEIGYIVSGFEKGGYLCLDRAVPAPHALYDSFQFGQPMTVWTKKGPVKGVLALPSLHIISRELRSDLQNLFVIENALLDIGVRSETEARKKGIVMLDPVTPLARICLLAGQKKSGPSLGTKVNTSVLLEVANEIKPETLTDKLTFAWLTQTKFPARRSRPRAALGALVAKKNLAASRYLVVDTFPVDEQTDNGVVLGGGPVLVMGKAEEPGLAERIQKTASSAGISLQMTENGQSMIFNAFITEKETAGLFIPLKFPATPNEIVDFRDVESLLKLISSLIQ
jgi:endoglucanase